ncbi:MAG: HEPN domain-containing protein [Parafilimonas sp.]
MEFNTAHKKADDFLQGAANYRGESNNEMVAFMLQQAAELIIRGLITALSGNCPKTHYFNELKKPLKRCLPALDYIISKNETEEQRLLHILEKAYLESRYSNEYKIVNADIDLLSEAIELLYDRAEILFKERIAVIVNSNF